MITATPPAESNSIAIKLDHLGLLAELIAGSLKPGDGVALRGDLGAGKTTLAKHIVRALIDDAGEEVTSPTFPIVQVYEGEQLTVGHFDFYRLGGADDVEETGYRDILEQGIVLIEWPDRAEDVLPNERLDVSIAETADSETRQFSLMGFGRWGALADRIAETVQFISDIGWGDARIVCLHGDASSRRYFRLERANETVLLMDVPARTDGPRIYDGKSYGEVAHIAEDARPFIAIDTVLREAGLSAPEIYHADIERGLLLIDDLGEDVFGVLALKGGDQEALWRAGVDVLLHLRRCPVSEKVYAGKGYTHTIAPFDRQALSIETNLLLQWYWPAVMGGECPDDVRAAFEAAWAPLYDRLEALPNGLTLRDFHSPNLIWLPERSGIERVGVIDFQDAVIGHAAYDLVSLLQDARVDVGDGLEERLLNSYVQEAQVREADFNADDFRFAYALLGAQRNTKILGIFARLALRDGKTQYLKHIPRIWGYVERNLNDVTLGPLATWYAQYLPQQYRVWSEASN